MAPRAVLRVLLGRGGGYVAGGSSSAAAEMSARRQRIGTVRAAVPRSTPGSARPIPLGQISARREDALAYSGSWCQAPEPEFGPMPDL